MAGSTKGSETPATARPKPTCHHRDESGRYGPECAATDLACPDTHGNHGQDVVGAEKRVRDAGHQRAVFCRIEVGKGRCRCCSKQGGGE